MAPAAANASDDAAFLTPDMTFNSGHVVSITCYSVLMAVSAAGNLSVLGTIVRQRGRPRTQANYMLVHLAIADLLVTFLMMPLEVAWAATVRWRAGDLLCRIMAVCRVFGLFLSSFVLVCISMDRYFAVLKPMSSRAVGAQRGRIMLVTAWLMSLLCSLPQGMVFSVQKHPNVTWYEQCMTWGVLTTHHQQVLYAIFSSCFMYGLPLLIILFAYASIVCEIFSRARSSKGNHEFRRSSQESFERAKARTLKMTVVIVLVFFMCWTPYNIMSIWYWLYPHSAKRVDERIKKGLFLFACTNSCMNPIVYGVFNMRRRGRGARGGGGAGGGGGGSAPGAGGGPRRHTLSSSSGAHSSSTYSQDSCRTSASVVV